LEIIECEFSRLFSLDYSPRANYLIIVIDSPVAELISVLVSLSEMHRIIIVVKRALQFKIAILITAFTSN
jgi:hypothetical protein